MIEKSLEKSSCSDHTFQSSDHCRWSLTFQTYVQLTMLETHTKTSDQAVKMMERSLYSAKYCFVDNLRKTGKMADSEYEVLSSWFDFLLGCKEIDLSVDLIVYLKVNLNVNLSPKIPHSLCSD